MPRFYPLLLAAAATAAVAQPAAPDPASVFKAYERAVAAGDRAAVAAMVAADPAPTLFTFCPSTLSNRDCLIDYLDRTVVTTHSVITPIAVTITGDTVEAKLEVRNDLTRAAGVERLAGTDRIKVAGGKIVAFAFVRDEADPQTRKFFAYMMSSFPRPGSPKMPGAPGDLPPPH